jgi:DNA-directed RNA polymerase specialized sigma24 family protein
MSETALDFESTPYTSLWPEPPRLTPWLALLPPASVDAPIVFRPAGRALQGAWAWREVAPQPGPPRTIRARRARDDNRQLGLLDYRPPPRRKRRRKRIEGRLWYEQPEFLDEQARWYRKLGETGFDDIEFGRDTGAPVNGKPAIHGCLLKIPEGARSVDADREAFAVAMAAAENGRAALAHPGLFKTKRQRRVWELRYEEGLSYQEIADALRVTTRKVRKDLTAVKRRMERR